MSEYRKEQDWEEINRKDEPVIIENCTSCGAEMVEGNNNGMVNKWPDPYHYFCHGCISNNHHIWYYTGLGLSMSDVLSVLKDLDKF